MNFVPFYSVDLTSLPVEQRISVCENIHRYAWESFPQYNSSGLVGVEFLWKRKEDVLSLGIIPSGCRCTKLGN